MKKQLLFLLLAGLLLLTALPAQAQTVRYVKPAGIGNGSSWANASNDLQAVVNASSAGDTVFVAKGVYTGGFYMKNGVQVYGGFAGTETATAQRATPLGGAGGASILDGAATQRVLTQPAAFAIATVWDGFVLQRGSAQADKLYAGMPVFGNNNQVAALLTYLYNADNTWRMMSLSQISGQWSTESDYTGATDGNNGVANMQKIKAISGWQTKYPLFYWADTLRQGGFTGWYLPAVRELGMLWGGIYTKKDSLNRSLKAIGATPLAGIYWSGSELDANSAWCVNFVNGSVGIDFKGSSNYNGARAVSAFYPFNHLNNLTFCGGAALLQGNGVLRNCKVLGSAASSAGGGIYAAAGAQVQGCLVEGNSAPGASGVYAAEGAGVVNSTVASNSQTAVTLPAAPQIGNYYYTDGSYSASLVATKELAGVVCALNPANPRSGLVLNLAGRGADTWNPQKSWAEALTTGGRSWRLPTVDELQTIRANMGTLNAALGAASGTQLSSNWYWSGSELDADNAWDVNFSDGDVDFDSKGYSYYDYARAVSAF